MSSKEIKAAIRDTFIVPEDIQRLANIATCDLLWGPVGLDDEWERDNYKGFQSACKRISEWAQSLPSCVWVDVDCGHVMTSEPEGEEVDGEYIEPFWEAIYLIDSRSEIVEYLLNHHIAGYL